jgi:hypothetical protein
MEKEKINFHKKGLCLNCHKQTEITYENKCSECGEQKWD